MKNIWKIDFSTYLLILLYLLSGMFFDIVIILFIVIFHELGHVFFFHFFKIPVKKVTIYPFGGMTIIEKKLHERIYKEVVCSLGGILFQIILWIFMFLFFKEYSFYHTFQVYNKTILLFNMIPLIPLDGSKILFSLFTKYLSFSFSYILMNITSFICFILLILYKQYDIVIISFLILYFYKSIKDYKYVMNSFYLERILYDHYYDRIVFLNRFREFKKNKFYFINMVNEKDYLKNVTFSK